MGGKSGSDPAFAPAASPEDFAYLDMYPDVAESGMNPYYHYQKWGMNEGRTYGAAMPEMPEFDFGAIFEALAGQREDYTSAQKDLSAQYAADQKKSSGLSSLDQAFSTKLDAATRSTDEVNAQVAEETAHAQTRGLDYAVTDEQKQERINSKFADYWTESSDAQFNDLYTKWGAGNTKYDWTLPVQRGVATNSQGALPKTGAKVGGKVSKGGTILTEEDEEKNKTLLGA